MPQLEDSHGGHGYPLLAESGAGGAPAPASPMRHNAPPVSETIPVSHPHIKNSLWKPGQSGNPHGRPSDSNSLAAKVKQLTKQGDTVIEFLLDVLAGNVSDRIFSRQRGVVIESAPTVADRLQAAGMLLDRGWGRPQQELNLSGQVAHLHLLASWSDEELEQLVGMRGFLPGLLPGLQTVEGEGKVALEGNSDDPEETPEEAA